MIVLIKNEFIKLFKRKKTLITLICFIALLVLVGYGTYKDSQNQKMYQSKEFQVNNMKETINNMKNQKENDKNLSDKDKERIDSDIKNMEDQLNILEESKSKNGDWKASLKLNISQQEEQLKQMQEDGNNDPSYIENMRQSINENKYYLNHNIKPKQPGDMDALSYLETVLGMLGMVFLPAGVALFAADMVSGEFTPPTMKFLLTQPISRGKLLLSKFIAVVSAAVLSIISLELISYLIMGVIFGFGNSNIPVFIGTKYKFDLTKIVDNVHPMVAITGTTTMTTLGSYVTKQLLLQILFIVASVSFAFMLSAIMKSSMVSVSIAIFVTILLTIIQSIPFAKKLCPFLFTTYGASESLFKGNLALEFRNPSLTLNYGIIVLVFWVIIPYIISHIIFTKKDILI